MLEPRFAVTAGLLGNEIVRAGPDEAVVVDVDLRSTQNILAVRASLGDPDGGGKRIFLIDDTSHLSRSQAYALGASRVLYGPVDQAALLKVLYGTIPVGPSPASEIASTALDVANALGRMFVEATHGAILDIKDVQEAGSRMAEAISEHGLAEWMDAVRRHHEGTFQHLLLVAGVVVDFGVSLGVRRRTDLERLYTSALLHDIGKAVLPVTVLDKPGPLDTSERGLVQTHSIVGCDLLRDNAQISDEVFDAIRHHHEFLDGSGYPDGISGGSISDLVRVLTMSDIFSALIEHRGYKNSLSREAAYDVLCGMRGKLEHPLLVAFRQVALHR
ncbi:HD domain-containing phosphohydrolase [Bradyrhizobium sp.]|uniref:HD-GYP domain-containing protein n=1 Tax=Bradyrhizobium sp. TaxID=376 RepID=UPI0025C5D403|nr:HD domain-containing phosphohydrolase [Bradyrhizobium sp.]